jgi:hypothetical protein
LPPGRRLQDAPAANPLSIFAVNISGAAAAHGLKEGAFQTNLIQWRVNYSFTPLKYIESLIQYNDRAGNWSANLRFGWLSRAGTGLFLVYNEGQGLNGLGPISRSFIVKYAKQFDIFQ